MQKIIKTNDKNGFYNLPKYNKTNKIMFSIIDLNDEQGQTPVYRDRRLSTNPL